MMLNKMNGSKFNAKRIQRLLDNVYEGEEDFEDLTTMMKKRENKDVNENVLSLIMTKTKLVFQLLLIESLV